MEIGILCETKIDHRLFSLFKIVFFFFMFGFNDVMRLLKYLTQRRASASENSNYKRQKYNNNDKNF